VLQLRDKEAPAPALAKAAKSFREATERYGALFIVNDDPALAAACGADGVHLGQEDMPPAAARRMLGDELLIGSSTHAPDELERALSEPVDYLGVGPVYETPTKEGRAGVGLEYVRYAAERSTLPFFVTGGMNARTMSDVLLAGATRIVVVRALTEAEDPGAAAKELRALLG
jgi:thiamine-phosphate pyrophosphorylase